MLHYVVVKRASAGAEGAYTLTLTDVSSVTDTCDAVDPIQMDPSAPDGYYEFNVADPDADGRDVTVALSSTSALDGAYRLFQANGTPVGACHDRTAPVTYPDLLAGKYYIALRAKSAGSGAGSATYEMSIRDQDAFGSLECKDGVANLGSTITRSLTAGDYYVGIRPNAGRPAPQNYQLQFRDTASVQPTGSLEVAGGCNADVITAADKGGYQLQIGEPSARTSTTYTPTGWTAIKDALATSDVRVLPVIATGGDTSSYVAAAEGQAKVVALTTGAKRTDGSAIWQKIQDDGTGTGSGLITGIAEIADYLAMDVSLIAVDGPDPGATLFRIGIAPVNSPSCLHPHPLVDPATGACTAKPGNSAYNCNPQYSCAPGSAPKFTVTFTNPAAAPVPPNTNDAYGGYHFKLQIIGNKKYLLDEVPVYIIPTTKMMMGPPTGGGGVFQSSGVYQQDIVGGSCPRISQGDGGVGIVTHDLRNWADLYFNADLPEGSSIDFELCTADNPADLDACTWWSSAVSNTRNKVTVKAKGTCTRDAQCLGVTGYGDGFCSEYGTCQFITPQKIAYDLPCNSDSACPNGPLGAGDYLISSHCQRAPGAPGFGYCIYTSEPADLGGSLLAGEQGRAEARVRVTLHADAAQNVSPTLYQWYLTYFCRTSQ